MPQTTYRHRDGPAGPPARFIIWGAVILPIAEVAPDLYGHRELGPPSFEHRTAPVPSSTHRPVAPTSFGHRAGPAAPQLEAIIWGAVILPILPEAPDLYTHRQTPPSGFTHRSTAVPSYKHRAVVKPE